MFIYLRDEKGVRENKGSVRQETPGIQEKQHAKGNVIKSNTGYSDNGHTNHGINVEILVNAERIVGGYSKNKGFSVYVCILISANFDDLSQESLEQCIFSLTIYMYICILIVNNSNTQGECVYYTDRNSNYIEHDNHQI